MQGRDIRSDFASFDLDPKLDEAIEFVRKAVPTRWLFIYSTQKT